MTKQARLDRENQLNHAACDEAEALRIIEHMRSDAHSKGDFTAHAALARVYGLIWDARSGRRAAQGLPPTVAPILGPARKRGA